MSPRDLALDALDYIGVATLAAASARQKARLAQDLTAALQKIFEFAPAIYKRRDGALVSGTATVTLSLTYNSTSVTTSDTIVDGSTLKIGGFPYNEARIDNSNVYLRIPFPGATGDYAATIYGDAIRLGADVDRVIGSVRLNEQFDLQKRVNRDDVTSRVWPEPDYGRRLRSIPSNVSVGQPSAYWVETILDSSNRSYLRMKILPLPNGPYSLGYDVRVRAPRISAADLGDDDNDSTVILPIAADMIEAALLPIFLERWAKSPWFKDDKKEASIKDDAKEARALLQNYRPQQPSNRRMFAPL